MKKMVSILAGAGFSKGGSYGTTVHYYKEYNYSEVYRLKN